jgi:hypothetical protein
MEVLYLFYLISRFFLIILSLIPIINLAAKKLDLGFMQN